MNFKFFDQSEFAVRKVGVWKERSSESCANRNFANGGCVRMLNILRAHWIL